MPGRGDNDMWGPNWIRSVTLSQCNSRITEVMCSCLLGEKTRYSVQNGLKSVELTSGNAGELQ